MTRRGFATSPGRVGVVDGYSTWRTSPSPSSVGSMRHAPTDARLCVLGSQVPDSDTSNLGAEVIESAGSEAPGHEAPDSGARATAARATGGHRSRSSAHLATRLGVHVATLLVAIGAAAPSLDAEPVQETQHFRDGGDGRHVASNAHQRYDAELDGRGLTIDTADGPAFGLESTAIDGCELSGAATLELDGRRATYTWGPGLSEWFVNRATGLEHGYTLERDQRTDDVLIVELRTRGELRVSLTNGARTIMFRDAHERERFRYDGLVAFDADGRDLPARFELVDGEPGRIALVVDDRSARYPITIDPIIQQAYIKATNTGTGDQFGQSVALDGAYALVGANLESSSATGVGGDQTDNSFGNAGAVYVLQRTGPSWGHAAYLKASNTDAFDRFGGSVDVSGTTVVVGANAERSAATGVNGDDSDDSAPNSGAAYVFEGSGTNWAQVAYLKASNTEENDVFGYCVAIDGDTIAIGAPEERSDANGVDGDQSDNSVSSAGAVYVFRRTGGVWAQEAYLKASDSDEGDRFGWTLALEGDRLVVGAPDEGTPAFARRGVAYVFERTGTSWAQVERLTASNGDALDRFGHSVALSGDTIVVGAPGERSSSPGVDGDQNDNSIGNAGAAYVFTHSGGTWSQQAYLKASNPGSSDEFGHALALANDMLVVTAHREASSSSGIDSDQNDNSAFMTGAGYLFTRTGDAWFQEAYLKGPDTDIFDVFGTDVAIDGTTVLIGSAGEDGSDVGVLGFPSDDGTESAGAAFAYEIDYWTVVPGCALHAAVFAEPTSPARIGHTLPLELASNGAVNGVVAPYFGALAADAFGCGSVVPGLGEVLLALAPFPKPLPLEPLTNGAATIPFVVPDAPSLAGAVVAIQAVAVDTTTFAADLSGAVVLEVRP